MKDTFFIHLKINLIWECSEIFKINHSKAIHTTILVFIWVIIIATIQIRITCPTSWNTTSTYFASKHSRAASGIWKINKWIKWNNTYKRFIVCYIHMPIGIYEVYMHKSNSFLWDKTKIPWYSHGCLESERQGRVTTLS